VQQQIDAALADLGVPADRIPVTAQEVADATAALATAIAATEQAEGETGTAQAERDQAVALADNAQLCAAGTADALGRLSGGDADSAVAALETVAPACTAAFDEANQP
jgi:hypothetical protein